MRKSTLKILAWIFGIITTFLVVYPTYLWLAAPMETQLDVFNDHFGFFIAVIPFGLMTAVFTLSAGFTEIE